MILKLGGKQETPVISVSDGGLITATAGDKSATYQLPVQAAQTITPGTASKTIAKGKFLTGTQTIAGDADLIAANIASGVNIFGVAGSLGGGGASKAIRVTGSGTETLTVSGPVDELGYLLGCNLIIMQCLGGNYGVYAAMFSVPKVTHVNSITSTKFNVMITYNSNYDALRTMTNDIESVFVTSNGSVVTLTITSSDTIFDDNYIIVGALLE